MHTCFDLLSATLTLQLPHRRGAIAIAGEGRIWTLVVGSPYPWRTLAQSELSRALVCAAGGPSLPSRHRPTLVRRDRLAGNNLDRRVPLGCSQRAMVMGGLTKLCQPNVFDDTPAPKWHRQRSVLPKTRGAFYQASELQRICNMGNMRCNDLRIIAPVRE